MKNLDIIRFALDAVRLRKIRSALTTLGVIVGITAIVALASISQGYQITLENTYQSGFSANTLVVTSGAGGFGSTDPRVPATPILLNESEQISQITHVASVTPVVNEPCLVDYREGEIISQISGINYTAYGLAYCTFIAEEGEIPETPTSTEVVVGHSFSDPWNNGSYGFRVGEDIKVEWTGIINETVVTKNVTLTISAILPELGDPTKFGGETPTDTGIYVSLDWATEFFETEYADAFVITVDSVEEEVIEYVKDRVSVLLGGQVNVQSSNVMLDMVTESLATTESFMIGIAGISLLVAGIGIMNIMIVSLMERTREVGIIKALGTKSRTVMMSFLAEAIIIGFLGSVGGLVFGYIVAVIFSEFGGSILFSSMSSRFMQNVAFTPVLTFDIVLGALGFGLLVSVVFGLYPAWRAARLTPVKSLRSV